MYLFGVTRWDHINKTCPYILVWGHSLAWIFLSGSPHEIQSSNMQEHSARASYIVLAPTLPRVRSAPLLQYRLSNQGETPFEIDINAHTYVWICKYIYRERERERHCVWATSARVIKTNPSQESVAWYWLMLPSPHPANKHCKTHMLREQLHITAKRSKRALQGGGQRVTQHAFSCLGAPRPPQQHQGAPNPTAAPTQPPAREPASKWREQEYK